MLANQTGLSPKYVSERHYFASQKKMTAGEAAKNLSKILGCKISAKELVSGYKILTGSEPEWHHAGFYKSNGKSTMGRTFFFSYEEIEELAPRWSEIEIIKQKIAFEKEEKAKVKVRGFYYEWSHDYSGNYGKKRNHKVLCTFEGSELDQPRNFTACDQTTYEAAKAKEGRKYYGWDEPTKSEFQS